MVVDPGEHIGEPGLRIHIVETCGLDQRKSTVKRTGVARKPLHKGEKLREKIDAQLAAIKQAPALVRSFFLAPTVAYYITDL